MKLSTSCRIALATITLVAVGCGGSSQQSTTIPASFEVRVSAGGPVSGATVTIYAMNDATGEVNTSAGAAGVLGTGGPTDSSGTVTVKTRPYSGPIQIVANGPALFYPDPTAPSGSSGAPLIQVPASFVLSSYLNTFSGGASMVAPVTLLTTLADHEALAFARGLHPAHPSKTTLSAALQARDPLFVTHITTAAAGWKPTTLRTTVPASLTTGAQTLVDVAYAALFDVALNQLANDTAAMAGFSAGSVGLTAPTLIQLLEADIDADGQLDGRGPGGQVIVIAGSKPLTIDAQFLRMALARSLDTWIRNTTVNLSGISEADILSGEVFSAIINDNSNLFGAPSTGSVEALLDRTPPVMGWATIPPVAVASTTVTLHVTATETQTGVQGVFAQVGTNEPVAATLLETGEWVVGLPLQAGPNSVSIWGVNNAAQPASGQFLSAPYELATSIISDSIPPVIGYNQNFTSYVDERGMTLGANSNGQALVPPVYLLASQALQAIPAVGGNVYKSAGRISWSATPSAALLETGGNPDNIPVLQFWVTNVSGVDAPIASATYSVATNCSACIFANAAGPLWPSPTTSTGKLFYDLPLAANLIPSLALLPGPATLSVTITVTDVAGNTVTATPVSLAFHTIGDPLAIVEDTTYPTTSDPKSTFPYTIATGLYSVLFTSNISTFLPENEVRLVRYLVSNPGLKSVALMPPLIPGGWQAVENWPVSAASLGSTTYQATKSACSSAPTCSGTTPISFYGGSAGYGCATSVPVSTDTPVVTAGDLYSFAYNQANGGDSSPAQITAGGQIVVPAASNGGPGTVALYVARSVNVPPRNYVLPWTGSAYQYLVGDYWVETSKGATICCDYDTETRKCDQYDATTTWAGTAVSRTLIVGADSLAGSFQLVTNGMSGTSPIGEPCIAAGSVSVTRSITH
ncbi:MAG TPA: hypothetical protein VMK12_17935 [Anaeromyxobacteraceae bacterium]|nr:hypothetical protein [Anaeromyxobacteraceae bacterium]